MLQSNKVIPTPSKNFKAVFNNFEYESDKALNNAIFEDENMLDEYDLFLDRFEDYAAMKKLQLEVFAVVVHGDYVYYFNKMDHQVTILNTDQVIQSGQNTYFIRNITEVTIKVPDEVFHENIYKLTLPEQETDAKAILRVRKGSSTEIFVNE